MNISITIKQGGATVDIIADQNRRIADVINELHSLGMLPTKSEAFMLSTAKERVISTENSFRDEGIFSGDKISEI